MATGEPLLRPRAIKPGDLIGVCALAGPVRSECIDAGVEWLAEEGHGTRCTAHLQERHGYLAGRDAVRLSDFRDLVRDPEVGAILLARGGYGSARLLRDLDADELRRARKPIVGYSDATSLALYLHRRAGLASIHGPMMERDDITAAARSRLLALLRGEESGLAPLAGETLRGGSARGPLLGGNLKTVVASLGTPWEIDTTGAILFLEEVNEQPYSIDRMLIQLRDAGKLAPLAGVAVGQLVCCESERYPEVTARDVVAEILPAEVDGPILVNLPFGHVADNRALGHGVDAELRGDRGTLALLAPVVD